MKRILRFLLWCLGGVIAALVAFYVLGGLRRLPDASGEVTDAVTGLPVQGIQAALYVDYRGSVEARGKEMTDRNGRFEFPTSFYWDAWWGRISGYLLVVNGPQDLAAADTPPEEMAHNGPEFGPDKRYFPVALQFPRGCGFGWPGTCRWPNSSQGLAVPLIPVVDNLEKCGRIQDTRLQEDCRQLNVYHAAFVDRSTPAALQQDEDICKQLDNPKLSRICIAWLHRLAAAEQ